VDELRITRHGRERLDDVEPLWLALHAHHSEVSPRVAGLPARTSEEGWALRRRRYEEELAAPGACVLLAERHGRLVGYAIVRTSPGLGFWRSQPEVGELETLVVDVDARGRGVGSALLDRARRELQELGMTELVVRVVAANEEAVAFYRRHGFEVGFHTLIGGLPGR
jgi:ribosomal protein S18 acetylase RimI-like enzyme